MPAKAGTLMAWITTTTAAVTAKCQNQSLLLITRQIICRWLNSLSEKWWKFGKLEESTRHAFGFWFQFLILYSPFLSQFNSFLLSFFPSLFPFQFPSAFSLLFFHSFFAFFLAWFQLFPFPFSFSICEWTKHKNRIFGLLLIAIPRISWI